jgi:hypothetical protein
MRTQIQYTGMSFRAKRWNLIITLLMSLRGAMRRSNPIVIFLYLIPMISLADTTDNKVVNFIENRVNGSEYHGDIKCATRYQFHFHETESGEAPAFNKLSQIILPQDTSRQRSMISPGGHFRLSWDESGLNAVPGEDVSGNGVPDFIDSALVIFDHVWSVEVDQMGYQPPLSIDGKPVSIYNVYFSNIDYYGITWFDKLIPNVTGVKYTSYMEVHNTFSGFISEGLDGLRVTAAHEFHHAIQFGYDVRSEDFFFYEMTSTWIENVIYPEVKDYYQYMDSFFRGVSNTSFDLYNSSTLFPYGNSIYLQMVEFQLGADIVRQIWEKFPSVSLAMDAIVNTLQQSPYNKSWQESLNEYGLWLYYTGDRAIPGQYFEDATDFPQVRVLTSDKIVFEGEFSESFAVNRLANKYIEFYDLLNYELTIFASTQNTPQGGLRWMTPTDESGFMGLNKAYTYPDFVANEAVFIISNASNSNNSYTLSVSQPTVDEIAISQNPVIIKDGIEEVQFKVPQNSEIFIYTVSGYLVRKMEKNSSQIRSWDLRNLQGDLVASGIYLWLVKAENKEQLNKFTIIR